MALQRNNDGETNASPELRRALDSLTTPPAGAGTEWADAQIPAMERLKECHPHTVSLAEKWSLSTYKQNCFMYAFAVRASDICDWVQDDRFFGANFVANLIEARLLTEICPDELQDGDVILYFNGNRPAHAGVILNDRVVSKWGAFATNIWNHKLFEVPLSYGNTVRHLRPPASSDIVKAFKDWSTRS
jgi:hypothetical protein